MKNYILIIISLILVPLWGLGSLSSSYANKYTTFILFIIVLIIFSGIKTKINGFKKQMLLLIGPLFYFFIILIAQPINTVLFNPVTWLVIFFGIVLFKRKINLTFSICFLLGALYYSFGIYPNHSYGVQPSRIDEINNTINKRPITEFDQIMSQIRLSELDKRDVILIETWNEKCLPCIKSIKGLQDSLLKISNLKHYLLYQKMGSKNLSPTEIRNFKLIKNKSYIIIDTDNEYFDLMNINSYPYFILYDYEGNYISHRKGYSEEKTEALLNFFMKNLN